MQCFTTVFLETPASRRIPEASGKHGIRFCSLLQALPFCADDAHDAMQNIRLASFINEYCVYTTMHAHAKMKAFYSSC